MDALPRRGTRPLCLARFSGMRIWARMHLAFGQWKIMAHRTKIIPSYPKADEVLVTLSGPKASESYKLSLQTYIDQFTVSLLDANFKTLIESTAGHWTTGSLPDAREVGNISAGATNPAVYKKFVQVVQIWTDQVSKALKKGTTGQGLKNSEREVFVRTYLPGHEYDCHNEPGPIDAVMTFSREWYNSSWIGRMNEAFNGAIAKTGDSRNRFLGLGRMALLRPDAGLHALSNVSAFKLELVFLRAGRGTFGISETTRN